MNQPEKWSVASGRFKNQLKLTKSVCKVASKEYVSVKIRRAEEELAPQ
jgi:hypothetical protein